MNEDNEYTDSTEVFLTSRTETSTLEFLEACFTERPEGWGHLDRMLAGRYLRSAGFKPYQRRIGGSNVMRWRKPLEKKKPTLPKMPLYLKDAEVKQ